MSRDFDKCLFVTAAADGLSMIHNLRWKAEASQRRACREMNALYVFVVPIYVSGCWCNSDGSVNTVNGSKLEARIQIPVAFLCFLCPKYET
jgi:hypothetical protein